MEIVSSETIELGTMLFILNWISKIKANQVLLSFSWDISCPM